MKLFKCIKVCEKKMGWNNILKETKVLLAANANEKDRVEKDLHLGHVYQKLTTQQEMRSQKFLRAGELSETKGRNFNFLLVIKLHVDITVDVFPGPAVWLWSWSFLIQFPLGCATMANAGEKLHFSISWNLKMHFWHTLEADIK